jgi:S1-C subfamily serine protease
VGDQVDLSFEKSGSKLQAKGKIKYIGATTAQLSNNGASLDYFLTDVAVLEVPPINDIEPLVLGESDGIKNLDDVILIGYPSGDYSITQGKINSDQYQSLNLFKTDAAANPGNSGGPLLLKEDNTVIAILVGGSSGPAQGENIALKINDVKALLKAAKINF